MLTAIVAVLGTLAGSLLTGVLQHAAQRSQRRAEEATARRTDGLAAAREYAISASDALVEAAGRALTA
ncbi:hypothetical protein [Streptomyces niveus]|uniref:hypothetical protein n=1 Tax=Streptomyces niveus TaxID=193462 RepID=UPI0003C62D34|nr:hypothetical protein [Streptomyces niveus]EST17869.1 hypothetical protein M877_40130 [Streptomyces niveus NCIMB 11891]